MPRRLFTGPRSSLPEQSGVHLVGPSMKAAFIFIAARVASGADCVGDSTCSKDAHGGDCCTNTAHYVTALTCGSHRRCGCIDLGHSCKYDSDCCGGGKCDVAFSLTNITETAELQTHENMQIANIRQHFCFSDFLV